MGVIIVEYFHIVKGIGVEEIHKRLKAELTALGFSTAEAARVAGLPDSQGLRDTLSGRKRVTADLLALLLPLGIDALYVLGGQHTTAVSAPTPLVDTKVLTDVIRLVEQLLAKTGRTFTPAQKAKHVVALYQAFATGKEMDAKAITDAMSRAA